MSKVLDKAVPRNLQTGKYTARIFHTGQPEFNRSINYDNNAKTCHKCLKPGHLIYECPNDWVCRTCNKSGHKMIDCQSDLQSENENIENSDVNLQESESEAVNVQSNDNQTKETADKQAPNTAILKLSHTRSISNKSGNTKTGPARNVQMSNVNTGQDKSQPSIDKFVNTPKMSRKAAAEIILHLHRLKTLDQKIQKHKTYLVEITVVS
ncbi:unnamed protein product [Mytilus coruscus]|uniref:CCHC-type domain-containing protein n=1 Tax=Mytilus coruscus TaxID=42192 RepID=A0A6J8ELC0_MYTCO|nr:unnamed protein product [Mytilus coruscus]